MTYREAVEWLYGLQLHGIKLGLENMRQLCASLEIHLGPSRNERGDFAPALQNGRIPEHAGPVYIHVAGTNGKGSVCAMLDAICREAGIRSGLYTSPHLVTFRERMRVDGEMIGETDVAAGLTRIRDLVAAWDHPPTFFEVTTALALDWFQDQHAHVVVLETGLGGRLDATNVVTPAVSVLTTIGLDHQEILGNTLVEIASEKCGIIKHGVPVVSAPQDADAAAVVLAKARQNNAPCRIVEEPWPEEVALPGEHQRWNAAVAVEALDAAAVAYPFLQVTTQNVAAALETVNWPGRFHRAKDRVVLDGAHNPAGARALLTTWQREYGADKATLILGMMRDKDISSVIAILQPLAARIFTVAVENARALPAQELAAAVDRTAPGAVVQDFASLSAALRQAHLHAERILVAGSLFLVGAALVELGLAKPEGEQSLQ